MTPVIVPENIAGHTDTLRDLVEHANQVKWHICEDTRDPAVHEYCDKVFTLLVDGIENAARRIDALQVQLAEARGLVLQHTYQNAFDPLLSAQQKRERMERVARICGFEVPRNYPYKTMEEAFAAMGITTHELEQ